MVAAPLIQMMPTCLVEAIQMEYQFKYCKSAWLEGLRHLLERGSTESSPAVMHYLKMYLKPDCKNYSFFEDQREYILGRIHSLLLLLFAFYSIKKNDKETTTNVQSLRFQEKLRF